MNTQLNTNWEGLLASGNLSIQWRTHWSAHHNNLFLQCFWSLRSIIITFITSVLCHSSGSSLQLLWVLSAACINVSGTLQSPESIAGAIWSGRSPTGTLTFWLYSSVLYLLHSPSRKSIPLFYQHHCDTERSAVAPIYSVDFWKCAPHHSLSKLARKKLHGNYQLSNKIINHICSLPTE